MKKLEIELYRYGTLVFGKVLNMDESLRCLDDSVSTDTLWCNESFDFQIVSRAKPELTKDCLFVRGRSIKHDSDVFYFNYEDIEQAKDVVECIKKVLIKSMKVQWKVKL